MRRIIILAAIAAIAATTAVWSIAMFAKPKVAGQARATETSAPVSPHEIMVKQGRSIPVEYWAHPFKVHPIPYPLGQLTARLGCRGSIPTSLG